MVGGLESRCMGHAYGADVAMHGNVCTIHTTPFSCFISREFVPICTPMQWSHFTNLTVVRLWFGSSSHWVKPSSMNIQMVSEAC